MFEQLTQLVQQFGNESIVKNNAIPNEQNEAVMNEASTSILSGLQKIASEGGTTDIAALIQGNGSIDASNPIVQKLTEQLSGSLGSKFGIESSASADVAGSLVPNVLNSLVRNAKDPDHKGFEISDLVNAISEGSENSGLMDAVSKYGGQFGLDQNADGKVDIGDAISAVSKGGLGGLIGKLFGK